MLASYKYRVQRDQSEKKWYTYTAVLGKMQQRGNNDQTFP